MRWFNTEGPIKPERHYHIPPLQRMDLDRILDFIRKERCFILHAPRQTGKTSTLRALQALLNGGTVGDYRCVQVNVEAAQIAREDVGGAIALVLDQLGSCARMVLRDEFVLGVRNEILREFQAGAALRETLIRWAQADPRPLVLLIDEIDALVGDSLLSVLRQLRSGYELRPAAFPQSIVLCGVRDIRDYRIQSSSGQKIAGSSAFNVSAGSLRLKDFTEAQVAALLSQHTAETGQRFWPEALGRVWRQTGGQPWLVNALCDRACFQSARSRDRSRAITERDIMEVQEQLILDRVTHLDQLAHTLKEDRVQRVIEPLLSGVDRGAYSRADREYVRDLGLIAADNPLRVANPIYREVIPRELAFDVQDALEQRPARYADRESGLRLERLLADFQAFFRKESEHWLERFAYREAGPQLLL